MHEELGHMVLILVDTLVAVKQTSPTTSLELTLKPE
jgi:hypothetical protein